ncbi:MAG TPA: MarR family transcriptional regulator [Actinocatenispora sp.]
MNESIADSRLAGELSGRLGTLTHLLRREVDYAGVSPTLATVLSALDRDGPKRVSELADIAQVAQPTMTSHLRRLAADGTVARGADPRDQRVVTIELTDAGRELLDRLRTARRSALQRRLDTLDADDRAALAAAMPALDKLLGNWRKADPQ